MGFLFENVVDSKGRKYDYPVAVGVMAGSKRIYAVGLGCKVDGIIEKWQYALEHPIAPVMVKTGRVHEVVMTGGDLTGKEGGLYKFPVPISTPGFDNAPYTTCSNWISKDPETGIQNIGNYRGHPKPPTDRYFPSAWTGRLLHWQKCKARGIPLEAALVIGPPPVVSYAAVEKVPYGMDEMGLAGGLAGEPIEVVRCKTVDLVVPADTELVIEGKISTEYLEPEGPFGESHGYMHPRQMNPYMDVTAITHRKDMIYVAWISQVTPSESSIIKQMAYEAGTNFLKKECRVKSVTRIDA
jgi:4-hydroxy-3-polyprenylbenzoate decarboxylase